MVSNCVFLLFLFFFSEDRPRLNDGDSNGESDRGGGGSWDRGCSVVGAAGGHPPAGGTTHVPRTQSCAEASNTYTSGSRSQAARRPRATVCLGPKGAGDSQGTPGSRPHPSRKHQLHPRMGSATCLVPQCLITNQ